MNHTEAAQTVDEIINLTRLTLLFGRTPRATFHEDGKRVETDTDHTVMLSLIATGLAQKYYPQLDLGLIAQFAMVHDLVEAYAGDTPTLKITKSGKLNKQQREEAAMKRLEDEFSDSFPIITELLSRYEAHVEPEARFVKAVDKIIPKATHILNKGATLRAQGIKEHEARDTYKQQGEDMLTYAKDFPEIFQLRDELIERMFKALSR